MRKRYEVFADYFQFYLWDAGARPSPPVDYSRDDLDRRVKAAPHVVVIQPVRNMAVPVTLDVVDAAPPLDLNLFDHVVEASLDLPSGRIEIHECTGGSVGILAVTPGSYRVRACFSGLDTLSDDGLDGDDRYDLTSVAGAVGSGRSAQAVFARRLSRWLIPWATARGRAGRRA